MPQQIQPGIDLAGFGSPIHSIGLAQGVPNSPAPAVLAQGAAFHQHAEMLFERVATGSSEPDHLTDRDAPMFAGELNDLQLQIGDGRQHDLLALHLLLQSPDLLGERAQEEGKPWLPVWLFGANRGLCLAKS